MRPDEECAGGPDQPEYRGGGSPLEYIDVGLGAARRVDVYDGGRSDLMLSNWSRLIKDRMPLYRKTLVRVGHLK
jgi:hypothetical protein